MALHYLGTELDVHGGGTDLIYPHHENEAAQSEAGTGHVPYARYWVHPEMVQLGGIKMSKSLGNLVLVRDLRARFKPVAVRHYLLSTHYRDLLDYSEVALATSAERIGLLRRALAAPARRGDVATLATWEHRFDAALADDLNTPAALAALDAAVHVVLSASGDDGPGDGTSVLRGMAARLGLD
jgi:cysteinyl-tRNA synthetase